MSREYILKKPGTAGGLVPDKLPAAVPAPPPPDAMGAMPTAITGIPVRICGGGSGSGAAPARGTRVAPGTEPHQYPAGTGSQLLSKPERTNLAILAGQAFAYFCRQDADYLADMTAQGFKKSYVESEWRHSQVKIATRDHPDGIAAGLTKAKRSQFRTIRAHFQALMSQDVESLNTAMNTGKAFGKAGRDGDAREDCEQVRKVLEEVMRKNKLNLYYVLTICGGADGTGGKFHTRNLESLTARQLWQLVYTLKNRAAARADKGDPANRNKSQRANAPGRKKNHRDAEDADDRGPF